VLKRGVCAAVLAAALVLVVAGPAWAHAELQSSDPPAGSHLPSAPSRVTLTFSENVSGGPDAVRVYDTKGHRVDTGVTQFNGASVETQLRSGLGDGGYIVAYRIISADSHPVNSALTFTVGNGVAPSQSQVSSVFDSGGDKPYQVAGALARWLELVGALAAIGLAVLIVMTQPSGLPARRLARALFLAAVISFFGALAELLPRAALATGKGIGSITESGVLSRLLEDGVGLGIVLLFVGLASIVFALLMRPGETARAIGMGGAVLVAMSFVPAGHPTTTSPRWLALGADFVHVGAAGVWFGGLLGLALVWRLLRESEGYEAAADLAVTFSGTATVVLVGVWLAGAALGWAEVRSLHALTSTTYGRVLLVKVSVVAVAVYLGALNHYRLVPSLARATGRAEREADDADDVEGDGSAPVAVLTERDEEQTEWSWHQLGQSIRTEVVLLVCVIGLSAVLVNLTPARTLGGSATQIARAELGKGSVELIVEPPPAGRQALHNSTFDASGALADIGKKDLTLELSLPSQGISGLTVQPQHLGPGHYIAVTDGFTVPGRWTITTKALVSDFDEQTATTPVKIG
jgi:copper transport protein